MKAEVFPCSQCGLCCENVHLAYETQYLDRGDGICKHYDEVTKHCFIYEQRPEICRVDLQYQLNYSSLFTWDEFVQVNLEACHYLQKQEEDKLYEK